MWRAVVRAPGILFKKCPPAAAFRQGPLIFLKEFLERASGKKELLAKMNGSEQDICLGCAISLEIS